MSRCWSRQMPCCIVRCSDFWAHSISPPNSIFNPINLSYISLEQFELYLKASVIEFRLVKNIDILISKNQYIKVLRYAFSQPKSVCFHLIRVWIFFFSFFIFLFVFKVFNPIFSKHVRTPHTLNATSFTSKAHKMSYSVM